MRKKIGVLLAAAVGAVVLAPQAGATVDPQANISLFCRGDRVVAEFHYSGFNPANQFVTAVQRLEGKTKKITLAFDAEGDDTDVMRVRFLSGRAQASTVVTSASGRIKAEAAANVVCKTPPPPEPDATSARLIGPCGDPMYAAVFSNRGGTSVVTFRWRYHAYGSGYTTLVKRVGPDKVFRTGYKHVTGSTLTTIKAHGDTLVSERTAPGGNYRPCR